MYNDNRVKYTELLASNIKVCPYFDINNNNLISGMNFIPNSLNVDGDNGPFSHQKYMEYPHYCIPNEGLNQIPNSSKTGHWSDK